MEQIRVVGAAIGIGAQDPRCQDGPQAVYDDGIIQDLRGRGYDIEWQAIVQTRRDPTRSKMNQVSGFNRRLAQTVFDVKKLNHFPVVLGGDHSCAIGTWSGVHAAVGATQAPMGLIWIDAHLDSHTVETSLSGAIHGMPLACLLGYGDPALTDIMGPPPKLRPEHVCLIGIRSFESGELALVTRLGVRVYYIDEVRQRGMQTVMEEALARVKQGTQGYGVSIDLDAMDPVDAPGVGSPESGGIRARDLQQALAAINQDPQLLALEITEYNPDLDRGQQTSHLIGKLIEAALLRPPTQERAPSQQAQF